MVLMSKRSPFSENYKSFIEQIGHNILVLACSAYLAYWK